MTKQHSPTLSANAKAWEESMKPKKTESLFRIFRYKKSNPEDKLYLTYIATWRKESDPAVGNWPKHTAAQMVANFRSLTVFSEYHVGKVLIIKPGEDSQ